MSIGLYLKSKIKITKLPKKELKDMYSYCWLFEYLSKYQYMLWSKNIKIVR